MGISMFSNTDGKNQHFAGTYLKGELRYFEVVDSKQASALAQAFDDVRSEGRSEKAAEIRKVLELPEMAIISTTK